MNTKPERPIVGHVSSRFVGEELVDRKRRRDFEAAVTSQQPYTRPSHRAKQFEDPTVAELLEEAFAAGFAEGTSPERPRAPREEVERHVSRKFNVWKEQKITGK